MKSLLCMLLLAGLMLGSANGQELVVVTEQRPPYNYEENGTILGLSTEIVSEHT